MPDMERLKQIVRKQNELIATIPDDCRLPDYEAILPDLVEMTTEFIFVANDKTGLCKDES